MVNIEQKACGMVLKTEKHRARYSYGSRIYSQYLDFLLVVVLGRLRATLFKSAERIHFMFLCYLGDAIRCVLSQLI